MPYIHDLPDWPNLIWQSDALARSLGDVRHKQGRILGRMSAMGFDLRAEASLSVLTSDVVKSSAIENEHLNAADVRSSIARRLGLDAAGVHPASREIEGVVEMMLDATQRYEHALTRERLFGWHAALFPTAWNGHRPITVGNWRTPEAGPMQVVSGPMGRKRVHIQAPDASRLNAEMAKFLSWFNASAAIDPVLHAGIAHLWFVTIHPFEDGNGRIARAIADMALARADGTRDRFYSMSTRIERERKDYYLQLESAQRGGGVGGGGLDITAWLAWFLACLGRAIDGADEQLGAVLYKANLWRFINRAPVNDRQRTVINRMLDGFEGHLNTSKYARLAKCSTDTALRDIKELLDRGIVVQNPSGGRSTSYRLADEDSLESCQ